MPEAPAVLDPPAPDPVEKADHAMYLHGAERVGGEANATAIREWGAANLTPEERSVYSRRLNNPGETDRAADELVGRFLQAGGARPYASLEEFSAGAKAASQSTSAAALHLARSRATPETVLAIPQE